MNFSNFIQKSIILIVALFVTNIACYSQSNAPIIEKVLLKNSSDTLLIESHGVIDVLQLPQEDLLYAWHPLAGQTDMYELIYSPTIDFVGMDEAQLEYRVLGNNNQNPVRYSTIKYKVVNSIVNAEADFYTIEKNAAAESFSCLDNDNSTSNGLEIIEIASTTNGIATIVMSQPNGGYGIEILFTPESGFTGMAYVNYVVQDDQGTTAVGVMNINVMNTGIVAYEVIDITTNNEEELLVSLESKSFIVTSFSQDYGEVVIDGSYMVFTPYQHAEGVDILELEDADGNERIYNISVIALNHDFGFVRNDVFYTSRNTELTFNVLENDIDNSYPIIDYSAALVPGTEAGSFIYTPDTDFVGEKTFNYTVWNGFESEEGKITIFINDYTPKALVLYEFKTIKNNALLMEYDIPLTNTYFQFSANPSNGELEYIATSDNLVIGCETIHTDHSMLYTPDTDFVGVDLFEFEYCIDGQSDCQLIKVSVEVVDEADDCHCAANCVWPGDANNDGKVRVDDLLALAYNMGSTGAERDDITYGEWYGQNATDWNENIFNEKLNTKFSDSDGNGIVSISDTAGIAENYTQYHTLLNEDVLSIGSFPFILIPQSTELDSGDVLIIDIAIGNENSQVIDLHGVSFSLNLGSELVDSASLKVNFVENSWFAANVPSIQMSKTPIDGYVEAAFSRIGRSNANGHGIIGQSVCIIEDELDDVRLSSGKLTMKIKLENATAIDADGNRISLPNAETEVIINISPDKNKGNLADKLICYPNPSTDVVNIHFNGGNIMDDIILSDAQGRIVIHKSDLNTTHHLLNLDKVENGIYFLKVNSANGVVTKKIEVFK